MTRVLFATAELAPAARVGGLAEAASGLVRQLRADGDVDLDVILPDYDGRPLADETLVDLDVPGWAAGSHTARTGVDPDIGPVTYVSVDAGDRPHPYLQPDGTAWPDLDLRFMTFAAGIASLVRSRQPDVVHLNDWHTAATLAFLGDRPPTVLTIHTLGYQGTTHGGWRSEFPFHRDTYEWYGGTNPLLGAIRLADAIIAVSPNYAQEILTPEQGAGLHHELAARGDALVGIRNGIDTTIWNPSDDGAIAASYDASDLAGKTLARAALADRAGWPSDDVPVIGAVTRLVDQKGIDLLADAAEFLAGIDARLFVLGSGDAHLASRLAQVAGAQPDRVHFVDGYDAALAHGIFAGADLFVMPSRFEPCGLAQMQAMAYGTLPVVTDVGGLHDTVTDADADPSAGTGILCRHASVPALVDGLHRGVRLWRSKRRRMSAIKRGMRTDWSWAEPAAAHVAIYARLRRS